MQQIIALLLLIVAVSASLQHPVESESESEYSHRTSTEPEPEYKFLFPFFKANWFKAIQYCKHQGLELATIDNAKKESMLYEAAKVSDIYRNAELRVWIGATDLAEEGEFHWYGTGSFMIYKNWGEGQPDEAGGYRSSEDCVEVALGTKIFWNDKDCKAQNYFVCE